MIRAAFLAACVLAAAPAVAQDVRAYDGDGIYLKGDKLRLWGIDAPERGQDCERDGVSYPCGRLAWDFLDAATRGQDVTCTTINRDRYGRQVARCDVNGDDLGALLVRSGWALDWPRYSGRFYEADQDAAREAGSGLWSGEFVNPWDWRKEH